MKNREFRLRFLCLTIFIACASQSSFAGISGLIQEQYKKDYENKAMFLKIPIYAEKQMIYISGQSFRIEPGSGSPRYKVGDQLRVIRVDFSGEEIKFRLSGIATPGFVELGFKFDSSLQESFSNRDVFNRALRSVLTEGLKYTDIDDAKDSYVQDQFDRAVREIAGSASTNRESVLKTIAPRVPAYQDAQRDIENLRSKVQDISAQLSQSQSENRKLESDSRAQQAELSRLKSSNAALQEKLETYTSQLSKLGDEVRDAKGTTQGYQKELTNLQRSLNLRVDASRDLTAQISDLGQAIKRLQKEKESLTNQIGSLKTNLDAQQTANARLVGDNEELKAGNLKLRTQITELTSKGDTLAKRHYDLGIAKEKLDEFAQAVDALRTRVVEESTAGGIYYGKSNVFVNDVLVGSLTWSIPINLDRGEKKNAEASFSTESIDYVRVTSEERHILKSLGEPIKIRLDLSSGSDSMSVAPGQKDPMHAIGERDHASWKWSIENRGTRDAQLVLTARLINKNSKEISVLQHEQTIAASNVLRSARSYLQPIPIAAGIILGFVLFGIIGIFRRPKRQLDHRKSTPATTTDYTKKQL
jgi:predicted nuclease with TOPRIM domain